MENVQQDIAKHSKTLMFKEPFYGLFLIGLNKAIDRRIQTACVSKNGLNCQLTVNDEFWGTLDDKTKTGVLKHELLHIAFMHLIQTENYNDKELFNIAADLEINQFIQDEFKGEKWNGLELSTFPELNLPAKAGTRKYYELLQKAKEENTSPTLNKMLGANGEGVTVMVGANGETLVTGSHEKWGEFDGMSEAEKKLVQKQIEHQIKETAESIRNRGTIPSELESLVDLLFQVEEPVINWAAYLRRFAGNSQKIYTKKTRRKENKRYSSNPALKIKQRKHILVGIDTSGSVSNDDLKEFFNEINHIWKTGTTITIAECDAAVAKVWDYKGVLPETITGRGGTDLNPIIDLVNDNPQKYNSLVLFTDGYIGSQESKCSKPLLTIICAHGCNVEDLAGWQGLKVKIQNSQK